MVKLAGRRILIVEEEALIAMQIEDAVQNAGATVVGLAATVEDASRAITEALRRGGIDAAVMDLNLNGEAAEPVLQMLRARGIPFVIATGYGEAGNHDVRHVLHKPFEEGELVDSLAAVMRSPRGG